ncbi:MAG: 3-hydroxyacyl-CoA dehydrogenase NAD-binding domain-containing protein [Pseudomonadota bacterium]
MSATASSRVAIIGMGSVGSGWAALLLAKGFQVNAYDPGEGAQSTAHALISGCWPSLAQLGLADGDQPPFEALSFAPSVEEAVRGCSVVIENVPEDLALKRDVFARADAAAPPDALLLSSAGGIAASDIQSVCRHPERMLVMHPFNPSHLIPLVEIVPGKQTSEEAAARTLAFARSLGKTPVTVSREQSGHMVNRLQFALVREAIRCLKDGVATPQDIDAAVRFGLAPRWLLMGGLQTVALAGGPGGMRGILDHAGQAMQQWWSPGDDIALTEELKEDLGSAADDLAGDADFEDWASWRDAQLIAVLGVQGQADNARPSAVLGEQS